MITKTLTEKPNSSVTKVKVTGIGHINRADGTKDPIIITGEMTEEQAKDFGATKEKQDVSDT